MRKKISLNISRRQFMEKSSQIIIGTGLASIVTKRSFAVDKQRRSEKTQIIVALAGSPRKGGNTDTLLTEILKAAKKNGAETEKIYLIDQNIKPCMMCDHCRTKDRPPCIINDDFNEIIEKIISADSLVFTTPTYWGNVSGMMKIFMERGYSLFDKDWSHSKIVGKSVVLIVCFGGGEAERQTGPVYFSLDMFLRYCDIDHVQRLVAKVDAKGEVIKNKEAMTQAAKIGRELANSTFNK